MTLRRLENSGWGFTSNCLVCEESNGAGLRIPFFHDDERDEVIAEFVLDGRFSGAPNYLHGGVALAILDEAMAWATIAVATTFAVTKETSARFVRPLRVDFAYAVDAKVVADSDGELRCEGAIRDRDGRDRVTAAATFVPLGPAQAVDAIGSAPTGQSETFIRGERDERA